VKDGIYDIAVLGAGIAGSAMAKAMASRGWSVALLDRSSFPKHKVCGEFLSPESLMILAKLGLIGEITELGPQAIERIEISLERGGAIRLELPGKAFGISRFRLDEALHGAAARSGAVLLMRSTVTALRRDGEGYVVRYRVRGESAELRAKVVVGASGGGAGGTAGRFPFMREDQEKEGVRSRVSLSSAADASASAVGIKAHFAEKDGKRTNAVELYFFRGGYAGVNGIEDGKLNVAAFLEKEDIPRIRPDIQGMLEEACGRSQALAQRLAGGKLLSDSMAAVSPVVVGTRPEPWDGIPLIGDAIARIPPLCGDGMSMALRSAYLCMEHGDAYLRGKQTMEEWRRRYSRAIESEFSAPLRWGRIVEYLLRDPGWSRLLPSMARVAPFAARSLVRATRLKL
jgi:flavin-dependent dehydrogenase